MSTVEQFAQDIRKWSEGTEYKLNKRLGDIIQKMFGAIIDDTPVSDREHKGRLKGNWQITANNPASGTIDVQDPSGAVTQAKLITFVAGLKISQTDAVFLTNNQPYSVKIEYGRYNGPTARVTSRGFSRQAPIGMLRKNFILETQKLKVPR